MVAPAAGPNRRTDVKTNVSEMEIVAGTDGRRTVADPLRRVSAARVSHCGLRCSATTVRTDSVIIAVPTKITPQTYSLP
jgi:hypothetical protein